MGFLEHLDELRTRLIHSCIAAAAGMLIAFLFIGRIADFVLAPVFRAMPPDTSLIMTRPGEGLSFYLDLALMGGVLLAAPFVTYQVWRFISPGLYSREKRLVLPFVLSATLGTLGGAAFSHYVLFPSMMAFFSTFDAPRIRFMPTIEHTFEVVPEHAHRHGCGFSDSNPGFLSRPDPPRHRAVPLAAHQVRRARHLHRVGGADPLT